MGFCGCLQKRKTQKESADVVDGEETSDLFFELRTLQIATNFFSELNLLGHGGFGPVYKGLMPNGQEIAVKKLSVYSRQGAREFTNEVKLLLRIQHKNLVRLLGCCIEGAEKMLVYEYLPNKSLDYFLFSKMSSQLKILLCQSKDGYMAPEYAMHGYLSVKSDVFSFGVLMLEIVSGRKNLDDRLGPEKADLMSYTWMLFQEGRTLELVDSSLASCSPDEAAMCIQLGLLCCQAAVADRPTMSSVNITLCSESFTLPRPGKPGIHGRRWHGTTTSSSAFTNTNPSSIYTGATKASTTGTFIEDFSRNSISVSSFDEGR
ncbi:hypothetical protein Cgig2_005661 [Carnegiea gigantea]|uniref:Protein kinase domain-containing protein n=1 Tax=Carnegiea gigantea TaxID=171969 RepID=A0A9Q1QPS1_9CARY|nr:hypothetical protein Cgig2_005661 [Carnegiea gigantea]